MLKLSEVTVYAAGVFLIPFPMCGWIYDATSNHAGRWPHYSRGSIPQTLRASLRSSGYCVWWTCLAGNGATAQTRRDHRGHWHAAHEWSGSCFEIEGTDSRSKAHFPYDEWRPRLGSRSDTPGSVRLSVKELSSFRIDPRDSNVFEGKILHYPQDSPRDAAGVHQ